MPTGDIGRCDVGLKLGMSQGLLAYIRKGAAIGKCGISGFALHGHLEAWQGVDKPDSLPERESERKGYVRIESIDGKTSCEARPTVI